MEKLDVLMLKAGDIIHYHGIPIQLTENTRVFGNAANFKVDEYGMFVIGSASDVQRVAE